MGLLEIIDLFGKEPKLKINRGVLTTSLGGVISIFVFLGTIALTWYFGKDIYEKDNPKYVYKRQFEKTYPRYHFKSPYFYFPFRLQTLDSKMVINDKRAFFFKYEVASTNSSHKKSEIDIKHCTRDLIPEPAFTDHHFADYFCPNFDEIVGGSYLSDLPYTLPKINIYRCNKHYEVENNITCYTNKEMIQNYGYSIGYTYVIQNNFVEPSHFDNPFLRSFDTYQQNIQSYDQGYEDSITYSPATVISDIGTIFEDPSHIRDTIQLEKQELTAFGKINHDEAVIKISFYLSRIRNIYTREYIKIPDIIANVGGFIDIAMSIINFFFSFYMNTEYKIYLYQQLFKLEIDETENSQNKILEAQMKELKLDNKENDHKNLNNSNIHYIDKSSSEIAVIPRRLR